MNKEMTGAAYMQEHPDDAVEIRDELKFWNEVMDHQVAMTKERAEATLLFLTALEEGPLFTNTSPIMLCPQELDPLDVRYSFPTAEPSSHFHATQASGSSSIGPESCLPIGPTVSAIKSLVFSIRRADIAHLFVLDTWVELSTTTAVVDTDE
ncbi:hypothetical protein DYB26_012375 [Aphanomyces astaci]|uniref:Uncharacterized protein n=1 Tax=Aphanomyces astaci TaxID=112090 RepID=A0A3R6ZA73_APHAT|nr:hypothetical protein DYB26_012375 [Aphanomyces astaci]